MGEYVGVDFDWKTETYTIHGRPVAFEKQLRIDLDGELMTVKLEFTREFMGTRFNRPVPVLKLALDGETMRTKLLLSGAAEDGEHVDLGVQLEDLALLD